MNSQITSPETIEHEIAVVRQVAGLSESEPVEFNDNGWDSRVYSFGANQYIMKFPRSAKVRGRYPSQISALKMARELSPDVTIPEILWEHKDHDYFGYRAVSGKTLTESLPRLDAAAKKHIGNALGGFLKQFHQLELPDARDMDPSKEISQMQDWYGKGDIEASGLFTVQELHLLKGQVDTIWPVQLSAMDATIRLCHGDLHFNNIFISQAGQVGLIDFGDICYADFSRDFSDFDDHVILGHALEAYGDTGNIVKSKIRLRQSMLRVITLTANLIKGDQATALQTAYDMKLQLK